MAMKFKLIPILAAFHKNWANKDTRKKLLDTLQPDDLVGIDKTDIAALHEATFGNAPIPWSTGTDLTDTTTGLTAFLTRHNHWRLGALVRGGKDGWDTALAEYLPGSGVSRNGNHYNKPVTIGAGDVPSAAQLREAVKGIVARLIKDGKDRAALEAMGFAEDEIREGVAAAVVTWEDISWKTLREKGYDKDFIVPAVSATPATAPIADIMVHDGYTAEENIKSLLTREFPLAALQVPGTDAPYTKAQIQSAVNSYVGTYFADVDNAKIAKLNDSSSGYKEYVSSKLRDLIWSELPQARALEAKEFNKGNFIGAFKLIADYGGGVSAAPHLYACLSNVEDVADCFAKGYKYNWIAEGFDTADLDGGLAQHIWNSEVKASQLESDSDLAVKHTKIVEVFHEGTYGIASKGAGLDLDHALDHALGFLKREFGKDCLGATGANFTQPIITQALSKFIKEQLDSATSPQITYKDLTTKYAFTADDVIDACGENTHATGIRQFLASTGGATKTNHIKTLLGKGFPREALAVTSATKGTQCTPGEIQAALAELIFEEAKKSTVDHDFAAKLVRDQHITGADIEAAFDILGSTAVVHALATTDAQTDALKFSGLGFAPAQICHGGAANRYAAHMGTVLDGINTSHKTPAEIATLLATGGITKDTLINPVTAGGAGCRRELVVAALGLAIADYGINYAKATGSPTAVAGGLNFSPDEVIQALRDVRTKLSSEQKCKILQAGYTTEQLGKAGYTRMDWLPGLKAIFDTVGTGASPFATKTAAVVAMINQGVPIRDLTDASVGFAQVADIDSALGDHTTAGKLLHQYNIKLPSDRAVVLAKLIKAGYPVKSAGAGSPLYTALNTMVTGGLLASTVDNEITAALQQLHKEGFHKPVEITVLKKALDGTDDEVMSKLIHAGYKPTELTKSGLFTTAPEHSAASTAFTFNSANAITLAKSELELQGLIQASMVKRELWRITNVEHLRASNADQEKRIEIRKAIGRIRGSVAPAVPVSDEQKGKLVATAVGLIKGGYNKYDLMGTGIPAAGGLLAALNPVTPLTFFDDDTIIAAYIDSGVGGKDTIKNLLANASPDRDPDQNAVSIDEFKFEYNKDAVIKGLAHCIKYGKSTREDLLNRGVPLSAIRQALGYISTVAGGNFTSPANVSELIEKGFTEQDFTAPLTTPISGTSLAVSNYPKAAWEAGLKERCKTIYGFKGSEKDVAQKVDKAIKVLRTQFTWAELLKAGFPIKLLSPELRSKGQEGINKGIQDLHRIFSSSSDADKVAILTGLVRSGCSVQDLTAAGFEAKDIMTEDTATRRPVILSSEITAAMLSDGGYLDVLFLHDKLARAALEAVGITAVDLKKAFKSNVDGSLRTLLSKDEFNSEAGLRFLLKPDNLAGKPGFTLTELVKNGASFTALQAAGITASDLVIGLMKDRSPTTSSENAFNQALKLLSDNPTFRNKEAIDYLLKAKLGSESFTVTPKGAVASTKVDSVQGYHLYEAGFSSTLISSAATDQAARAKLAIKKVIQDFAVLSDTAGTAPTDADNEAVNALLSISTAAKVTDVTSAEAFLNNLYGKALYSAPTSVTPGATSTEPYQLDVSQLSVALTKTFGKVLEAPAFGDWKKPGTTGATQLSDTDVISTVCFDIAPTTGVATLKAGAAVSPPEWLDFLRKLLSGTGKEKEALRDAKTGLTFGQLKHLYDDSEKGKTVFAEAEEKAIKSLSDEIRGNKKTLREKMALQPALLKIATASLARITLEFNHKFAETYESGSLTNERKMALNQLKIAIESAFRKFSNAVSVASTTAEITKAEEDFLQFDRSDGRDGILAEAVKACPNSAGKAFLQKTQAEIAELEKQFKLLAAAQLRIQQTLFECGISYQKNSRELLGLEKVAVTSTTSTTEDDVVEITALKEQDEALKFRQSVLQKAGQDVHTKKWWGLSDEVQIASYDEKNNSFRVPAELNDKGAEEIIAACKLMGWSATGIKISIHSGGWAVAEKIIKEAIRQKIYFVIDAPADILKKFADDISEFNTKAAEFKNKNATFVKKGGDEKGEAFIAEVATMRNNGVGDPITTQKGFDDKWRKKSPEERSSLKAYLQSQANKTPGDDGLQMVRLMIYISELRCDESDHKIVSPVGNTLPKAMLASDQAKAYVKGLLKENTVAPDQEYQVVQRSRFLNRESGSRSLHSLLGEKANVNNDVVKNLLCAASSDSPSKSFRTSCQVSTTTTTSGKKRSDAAQDVDSVMRRTLPVRSGP